MLELFMYEDTDFMNEIGKLPLGIHINRNEEVAISWQSLIANSSTSSISSQKIKGSLFDRPDIC